MKKTGWFIAVGLILALATSDTMAQEGAQRNENAQRRRGGRSGGRPGGAGISRSVAGVVTNDVIANAINLTLEQRRFMSEKLDADKARLALAAASLAESVVTILTDPEVASGLAITAEQVTAIEQNITPELIKQALTAEEIERLSRGLTGGAIASSMASMARDRMMQFDADGDGKISDEERRTMMEQWRQRMGGRERDAGARRQRDAGARRQREPDGEQGDVDAPAAVE